MIDVPQLLTVAQFCALYSIGKTSFYRSVAKQIPLRKFGTATRIARSDAEAWVKRLPVTKGDNE